MIKKTFLIFIAFAISMQTSTAQLANEIASFQWNKPNGLPYIKGYSANYSVDVFTKINKNEYAFLSKTEKKILVFNINSNKKTKEILLNFSPVDFVFSNNKYFIAGHKYFYTLDIDGKIITKKNIRNDIIFTESIKIINNKAYITTPNQFTYSFNKNGKLIKHSGIILNINTWAKIEKINKSSFNIKILKTGRKSFVTTITTNENLGTVKIIGQINNNLIIEKQVVTQEVPLKVTRYICVFSIDNLSEISKLELPNIAYTYTKHDILIQENNLDFFISTPKKASLFKLKLENIKTKSNIFPNELYQYTYHYNNNLVSIDEKEFIENKHNKAVKTIISRMQIISNAEPYAVYNWSCNAANIKDYDCSGVHVTTPDWVQLGENISMPYMWGGFSSLAQFNQGIIDGVSAGDSYTVGNGSGPGCAVGVDCSGFVSRAWNLPYKYGTSTLPNISTEYTSFSQLLPGDIVNYAGHHVRLVHTLNTDGSFLLIEAAANATDWRVGYNNYTTADLQLSYIPRYYNDVIEDIAPPTSSITANDWATQDFSVGFTDTDDNAINEKFYHVAYFDGTQWLGNTANGFFHDNFPVGINPQWIQLGSTWTNILGTINQSDEANTNTNIYANVLQTSGNIYLYKWKMKISGTGTNRRAGIYFMCDDATQTQRNNSYMVYFRVDQNKCQIYKAENNIIDLKTNNDCSVNANQWFDATIIYNSSTGNIKVYKNDTLVSSWTDENPLNTGNSISLRTGAANVSYDDFEIYRSRSNNEIVSMGANADVQFQNQNPSAPACFIESIVTDMAGNFSPTSKKYVNIDWTKPLLSTIADGLSADEDSTINTLDISANWQAGIDENSGINEYYYCVGTNSFSDDIIAWTNNANDINFTETGFSLNLGTIYYVSAKAVNAAGLVSDTICSDGNKVVIFISTDNLNISNKVEIYPIPAQNNINIVLNTNLHLYSIQVFDINAKIINLNITNINSNNYLVDTKNLSDGIYIIKMDFKNEIISRKFIIKH